MSLKVRSNKVRRTVSVLKKPTPTYVSIVDHAATQTPFAVVKRGPKPTAKKKDDADMAFKRSNKKQTRPSAGQAKAKKSASDNLNVAVYKLVFQQDTFKTEKAVKAWLKKSQWTGDYEIKEEDGEWVVKSKTAKAEDHFDLREVALEEDGSISALVSKTSLGPSELTAKAGKTTATDDDDGLGNATQSEGTGDDDDDGTDEAGTKVDNASATTDDDDDAEDGEEDEEEDEEDDIEEADLSAADGEDIDGNDMEDDDGENAEGDYNHDNDPSDDDAEGAEAAAGVDDPEGYGDRHPGKGEDDKGGHRSIREKEKNEPLPKDLPGQSITPTGAGKPGHEPGTAGKYRIQRRMEEGCHPLEAVDQCIQKFDGYSVYLSGGMTLKEVLEDGLSDGIPPGVSEVFQSLYKAVGNTLKSAKSDEISTEINTISTEFTEAVVALHGVWKGLLKNGTNAQKKHAKKWMLDMESHGGVAEFNSKSVAQMKKRAGANTTATVTKTKKRAPVTTVEQPDVAALVAEAVAKQVAPVQKQLDAANARIKQLSKPIMSRKGLGSDDLEHANDAETLRMQKEAEDDEAFLRERSRKAMFGTRG